MSNILKVAVEAVDAEVVILHHYDGTKFNMTLNSDGEVGEEVIKMGEEVEGFAAQNNEFVLIDDFKRELERKENYGEGGEGEDNDDYEGDVFDLRRNAELQKHRNYTYVCRASEAFEHP